MNELEFILSEEEQPKEMNETKIDESFKEINQDLDELDQLLDGLNLSSAGSKIN